tara:strand:- start:86584 stop:86871 length:288 start_codon:yes stop_codon:yes gene_type:complete
MAIKKLAEWEIARDKALIKKAHIAKWKHVGLEVRRKDRSTWEYGTIDIFDISDDDDTEYCIDFHDGTREQLLGLPFEVKNDYNQWVDGYYYLDNL